MRIKQNRTILESDNPFVIEQWKKAGYAEVGGKSNQPTSEPLSSNEPLNDVDILEDGASLSDGELQDEEPKKVRKKVQE